MAEFSMPSLGADMEHGEILEWLVQPGDTVHRGDIVAVVKTDKADVEVEIFQDGVIDELLVDVGVDVPVGTPLATVRSPGAAPAEPVAPAAAEPVAPAAVAPPVATRTEPAPAPPPVTAPAPDGRARVSPRARRLAAERGVDVTALSGGAAIVTGADVERATPVAPAPHATDQQSTMRAAIAAAMSRSNREIPHYHLLHHTPLSHALAWLEHRNAERSVAERVLPVALFCRAVVVACTRVPGLNGTWVDDAFRPSDAIHLGFAVSMRGGGLIAPAVLDAEQLDLDGLMSALRDLTNRVRGGRLRSRELTDGTITVTNLGERGVEVVHGVIYPPQVALVGFGTVLERPWAEKGAFCVRPVVATSLAGDHRAGDGRLGARFLAEVDTLLRNPEQL